MYTLLYKQWILYSMELFILASCLFFYIDIEILFKSVTSNFEAHTVPCTTQSHMVKKWKIRDKSK